MVKTAPPSVLRATSDRYGASVSPISVGRNRTRESSAACAREPPRSARTGRPTPTAVNAHQRDREHGELDAEDSWSGAPVV